MSGRVVRTGLEYIAGAALSPLTSIFGFEYNNGNLMSLRYKNESTVHKLPLIDASFETYMKNGLQDPTNNTTWMRIWGISTFPGTWIAAKYHNSRIKRAISNQQT